MGRILAKMWSIRRCIEDLTSFHCLYTPSLKMKGLLARYYIHELVTVRMRMHGKALGPKVTGTSPSHFQ